jgi:hypothetical protein
VVALGGGTKKLAEADILIPNMRSDAAHLGSLYHHLPGSLAITPSLE